MSRFVYKGAKTREISFPLGGIGSGCIGLAGNGRLVDWEIFNKPNKGGLNGFSHFAIKAERDGKVLDARVLNGDLPPPYSGSLGGQYKGFGFGPARETMAGIPHFHEVEFRGEFPIAELRFKEKRFPGRVRMTAFSPFIPLNDKDSGIPAAFFEIEVKNTAKKKTAYTIAATLGNPLPAGNVNRASEEDGAHLLRLGSGAHQPDEVAYGDLTLATDAEEVSAQEYWYRGRWFDSLEVYWRDFTTVGTLKPRRYPEDAKGKGDQGTLAAHLELAPGEARPVRFVIAWNFPNCENYWRKDSSERAKEAGVAPTWKNYYATQWDDSGASALYAISNWGRLWDETLRFKDALFSSDLPDSALDAVSANLAVLRSPTVMRLEDGTFYGWEGCHTSAGCCEGSCTHVWNYAQALPFLFPALERSMREANYRHNQDEAGGMRFRMQIPLGIARSGMRPCADGQFGDVMKTYRDWKISGDTEWLKDLWPAIKRSIEYAWSGENPDRWDPERTGVLHGRQHHTLDMELFGPNSWLTGYYLGALKAAAEMAEALGERGTAVEYRSLFEKGKAWADEHLFNGEYYCQLIDLADRELLRSFDAEDDLASETYWSAEHGEMKYQIGEGSEIDACIAQWHANLYGVGEIFDPGQVKRSLAALFKHSFKDPMGEHYNPCRIFCLNDEAGLVICEWPEGRHKPAIPLTYSQETMHGYEYAAAIHMIQAGLVKEGMAVVESVRDRYDGERRNPWNEIECGSNYARSMASYALLNVFSGFEFDMVKGAVGFNPLKPKAGKFRCFWSLETGWGTFRMKPGRVEIEVLAGTLEVAELRLPFLARRKVGKVSLGGDKVEFTAERGRIEMSSPARIEPGRKLAVAF
ncbi:MAG: GH116 family glycosyl-hydrolase [Planctomycetota bacterium]|jgi:uncharacterized protein (DUF608 family)